MKQVFLNPIILAIDTKSDLEAYEMAQEVGAECIITACPMCHANLDLQQQDISQRMGQEFQIPIFYFTELMAIAFGVPNAEACLKKHFADSMPLLESKNLLKPV